MKSRVLLTLASVFLFAFTAAPMWAEPLDPMVKLTVKQPVEVPGHVLMPGEYYVTQLDQGNAVLVRSADGSQAFFEIVGSASRLNPAAGVVVDVAQQEASTPRIMDYFFPGDTYGIAFYYPAHPSTKATGLTLRSQKS